jgi:hypothetical protein
MTREFSDDYIETKANVGDLTAFIDAIEALVRTLP